jgi:hypothetical protein
MQLCGVTKEKYRNLSQDSQSLGLSLNREPPDVTTALAAYNKNIELVIYRFHLQGICLTMLFCASS